MAHGNGLCFSKLFFEREIVRPHPLDTSRPLPGGEVDETHPALDSPTLSHPRTPSRSLRCSPMIAILAADECVGLVVALDLFGFGVEVERAAESRGDVSQMTEGCGKMPGQRIGRQLCGAANRVAKILDVRGVVLSL